MAKGLSRQGRDRRAAGHVARRGGLQSRPAAGTSTSPEAKGTQAQCTGTRRARQAVRLSFRGPQGRTQLGAGLGRACHQQVRLERETERGVTGEQSGFEGGGSSLGRSGLACLCNELVDPTCVPESVCLLSLCPHLLGPASSCSGHPGQPHGFGPVATVSGEDAEGVPVLTCPPTFGGFISDVGRMSLEAHSNCMTREADRGLGSHTGCPEQEPTD